MVSTAIPVELNKSLSLDRKSYARIADVLRIPSLIDVQRRSFKWFLDEGLRELFAEISPIQDFTSQRLELRCREYAFGEPKYSDIECRERDMTFAVPLRVRVQRLIKETGEIKEQDIFMGDFPKMTQNGTFVINGAERVVVSQLVRSPGSYFTLIEDPTTGRELCYAKLIPNRGAWLEFETSNKDVISVKADRKRKIPVTTLLRAVGFGTDDELFAAFGDVEGNTEHNYIKSTIDRDPTKTVEEGLIEFYKGLRPGAPPTMDTARSLRSEERRA